MFKLLIAIQRFGILLFFKQLITIGISHKEKFGKDGPVI